MTAGLWRRAGGALPLAMANAKIWSGGGAAPRGELCTCASDRPSPRRSSWSSSPLASTGVAGAYPFTLSGPTLASTASPFTGCPVGAADATSVNYPNTEPEPFVAVNPTNPQNLVGVYQQDRWSDGAAKAQGTAVSFDGGASWSAHAFVPFSECAGGNPDFDRTTDPWVTFDPNGNAYQISLPVSADLEKSAVAVSKSTDGGLSWDAPKR